MTMRNLEGPPKTESSLRRDLVTIGVTREMTLLVHSSLSSIGWVVGGPPTVVRALLHVVGERSTVVMPAATPHCTDPATWSSPRVPEAWLAKVREHLPIFDPRTTPSARGAICETFRKWPNTLRSNHPVESVCARGVAASTIVSEHPLAFSEGRGGPFEKLYDLDCWVLLVGVGFNRCTALHFAESLRNGPRELDSVVSEIVTTRASYRRRVRRERFEWPPEDCIPGSPWTGGSLRFGNRLRRTFGCGSTRRLSA